MAWPTLVQTGDTGTTYITSGSPASLGSNPALGNTVLIFTFTGAAAGTYTSITSSFGTPVKLGRVTTDFAEEAWIIPVTSSGSNTVTATTSGGATNYTMWYAEIPGAVNATWTSNVNAASTNPTITFTSLPSKQLAFATFISNTMVPTGFTGTGWTDYNTGEYAWSHNTDVAYSSPTTASNNTVTWTSASGGWSCMGVVCTAVFPPRPSVGQAVKRAAFY